MKNYLFRQFKKAWVILGAILCLASACATYAQTTGPVWVEGRVLHDDDGPFFGLGATYMQALRRVKFDRERLRSDLASIADGEFNYIRILSMVGRHEFWEGLEIAPVDFVTQDGRSIQAWPDYWQQLADLIDIAFDDYGVRTEITIFADAELMPERDARIAHMDGVLSCIAGREQKVILLEVANEAWQNGFWGEAGIAQLREFGGYLGDRTAVPVALSSPLDSSIAGIEHLYVGSAADIATIHFERDNGTIEGGWLPVRDCWRFAAAEGVPPASSNEPIGPGTSVASEDDPIKLVSAAAFAWIAGLPMYVYTARAGIKGDARFEDMPAIGDYTKLQTILPPDLAGWTRNDGLEPDAPLTVLLDDQADTYWTDPAAADAGVLRNVGAVSGDDFVCLPMGILSGGVDFEARRALSIGVFHPIDGAEVLQRDLAEGERVHLDQGPGAWLVKGRFIEVNTTSKSDLFE